MSKILIVEDDAEIAMLEKDYLEINDFETEIIANGMPVLTEIKREIHCSTGIFGGSSTMWLLG